ncbi:DeoR/GlpR family DNA-binding transcription regulator [Candidatus Puniceispirillum sp.]|uniref:DeoR/GlpR family DNA-binding transcription regulator n=1 Tax=Candidatus Puniceispirillum sp. TaxID=2026719 RepID=UPI003F6A083B
MTLNIRQNEIIGLLRDNNKVDVDELAARFDVTAQTVRRDLGDLCDRGLAMRTHGGARRVVSTSSRGYEERRLSYAVEKAAIGKQAAQLIPNNCSVFLNIGTTTEQVAKALTAHNDLTVISNNINVIQIFLNAQLRELVLVGGAVRKSDGAIVGDQAVEFIGRYKADFAIIGASSLDSDGSVLDFDDREVAVARAIIRNARIKVLVTDISKFENDAPVRICDVSELDYVITDARPPDAFCAAAEAGNTSIIIVNETN